MASQIYQKLGYQMIRSSTLLSPRTKTMNVLPRPFLGIAHKNTSQTKASWIGFASSSPNGATGDEQGRDSALPSNGSSPAPSTSGQGEQVPGGRVISTPPPGRSFPKGPPVPKGMKLERVERLGEESWAGVAAIDRGEGDSIPPPLKTAILCAGDTTALLLFATIGRLNHGEGLSLGGVSETALPFLLGWFLTAPFLGGYGKEARGGDVGAALGSAAKCWIAAIPVGLAIRSVLKGYVPEVPFIVVSMAANAFLIGGWRGTIASLTPAEESGNKRRNRKGNPFEFFSLLFSLVKRW